MVDYSVYGFTEHKTRHHVWTPQEWAYRPGTDFWAFFGNSGLLTSGVAHELSDYGWSTTALAFASPDGADFMSSDDIGTPNGLVFADASDLLQSPAIFGDYTHGRMVEEILGKFPTQFAIEIYAAFTTVTGTSNRSGFGLVEAGGTAGAAADELAWIYTDGTNFTIRSDADSDVGAADDTDYHLWKIVVSSGDKTDAVEWFIDGVSQGTMDRKTDEWPVSFGVFAHTTNRFVVSWVHAYYLR